MATAHKGDTVRGWVLERCIGSGSFATVWKAHKAGNEGPEVAAVKIIATERLSAKLRQSLESEISILKRISHKHVVQLFEVVEVRSTTREKEQDPWISCQSQALAKRFAVLLPQARTRSWL